MFAIKAFWAGRKKLFLIITLSCLSVGLVMLGIDRYVSESASGRIFEELEKCPQVPVAVVLGTSKYYNGRLNVFYLYRIRAAAELFRAGKVNGILVSGDNSRKDYDEPSRMKEDIVELGVPGEFVTCDYAGFRTLDSIVRAKEVFGQSRFIVVSQRFHCERAVFLGHRKGYDVYGYCANDAHGYWHLKVRMREIFARFKAGLDLAMRVKPKYLGKPVTVNLHDVK
ncbi:MAG: ElyC/SanA/YdcF family protein [Phycisphaerales bacterium]